ncbi:hypothetical protein SPLC1_S500820 [Arthrospira platensis C1]|uniref:Uncharacterized protein n=1 Tax=Limnospira fusiformis PMC 851.14 TaxID=2219512 RepID=A0ABU9EEK5_LIMFS|nr:hypothetical protein SPLC1_S500820 [Arthrospira platensis C1]
MSQRDHLSGERHRGQETRFLKETGFLMGRKLTAEPTPTMNNYRRGQETRFLK